MYTARNIKNQHNCFVLFEHLKDTPFIILDTETTGLHPDKDYIVELAAVKHQVIDCKLQKIAQIDFYLCPPFKMDEKVIAIHGITNEFLQDKPTEKELFPDILKFLEKTRFLLDTI